MITIIRNIFIINNGVLLLKQNFIQHHNLDSDVNLISAFICAIQTFSSEVTHSTINTINFENFTFHFYQDPRNRSLLYIFESDRDYNSKEINCKLLKIASLFYKKYSSQLDKFSGDVSQFDLFKGILTELKINQEYCGSLHKCIDCSYKANSSQIVNLLKNDKQILIPLLNKLLLNLLNIAKDLLAVLIIDNNGTIIAQQCIKENNDYFIPSIMKIIDPFIEKINIYSKIPYGSGIIDINEFKLFYLDFDKKIPALFIAITGLYSDIDAIKPYFYIVAEKASLLLNNRLTSITIPKLQRENGIEFKNPLELQTIHNVLIQVILIGSAGGGKSSLIEMYVNGKFLKNYKPTIGISIVEKELQIAKRTRITFILLDMGGLKSFAKIREYFYKISEAKAIIIVSDYTKMESFDKIDEWLKEAQFNANKPPLKLILVGNKIDLIKNREEAKNKAKKIAAQYNCIFFETSALTGEGIDELFMYLI